MTKFKNIGIIQDSKKYDDNKLSNFLIELNQIKKTGNWKKEQLVSLFERTLDGFKHREDFKNLDQKM